VRSRTATASVSRMVFAGSRALSGNMRADGNRASPALAGFAGAGGRRHSITLTRSVTFHQYTDTGPDHNRPRHPALHSPSRDGEHARAYPKRCLLSNPAHRRNRRGSTACCRLWCAHWRHGRSNTTPFSPPEVAGAVNRWQRPLHHEATGHRTNASTGRATFFSASGPRASQGRPSRSPARS